MGYPVNIVTRRDKIDAAAKLGTTLEVVEAVTAVESSGRGFIPDTDWPVILFEGHKFHDFTDGRYSDDAPTISYPRWTKKHYRGGRGEYDRLTSALALCGDDPSPALRSCSWGMFQIMGFNHEATGFDDVTEFVNAMATGERQQLMAFCEFVLANSKMTKALRDHEWAVFAHHYNGSEYRQNRYDIKLASAFAAARLAASDPGAVLANEQRDRMAQLQVALNAAVSAGLAPDGWIGPKTRAAIEAFQKEMDLPVTGDPDAATLEALQLTGDYRFALHGED